MGGGTAPPTPTPALDPALPGPLGAPPPGTDSPNSFISDRYCPCVCVGRGGEDTICKREGNANAHGGGGIQYARARKSHMI